MTAEHPQDELPLQTLAEFQQAHETLLDHYDQGDAQASEQARLVPIIAEVRAFLRRGAAGGAYLFESRERRSAQGMLDYWASLCYGTQLDIERAVLAPHDPDKLPQLNDDDCPYVGLEAFGKSNAINFFGRTERVQAVLQCLEQRRLVVVTGSSGSGKSSLVLAGVQPALMEGGLPGSADWRYPPALVPGSTPLDNLAAAIAPGQGDAPAKALLAEPASLAGLLGDTPTLLVIDQFEEVMTLRTDDNAPEFGAFVAALLSLLDDPDSPHRLLLTMRSDVESPRVSRRPVGLSQTVAA
ncbi:MAG: hypothetical protein EKK53_23030 [Burkholderiales bacterium]|nr:MAG: hypothetical protein EKK53_23030 [Burkholderiales bacterium]